MLKLTADEKSFLGVVKIKIILSAASEYIIKLYQIYSYQIYPRRCVQGQPVSRPIVSIFDHLRISVVSICLSVGR